MMRVLCLALAAAGFTLAQSAPDQPDRPIDAARRHEVIEAVAGKLTALYVYPDMGAKIAAHVREQEKQGAYNAITSSKSFAETLTADLQSVNHDRHLRVFYGGPVPPPNQSAAERDQMRAFMGSLNFGYDKLERLPGNIGYLEVRGFMPRDAARETASAALGFLANTDALIIDIRRNGGGDPSGVALLCSYLFGDKPVHINDLYWREGNRTEQFWTDPKVAGRLYGADKPVYVLTSAHTFSGAEEFAYDLQQQKRATIIGEVTGGGAHPGDVHAVGDHFAVFIPGGRAINPVTKKDWEGTGVKPDVPTTAANALRTAHAAAIRALLPKTTDAMKKRALTDALADL